MPVRPVLPGQCPKAFSEQSDDHHKNAGTQCVISGLWLLALWILAWFFVCLLLKQGPVILARLEIDMETRLTLSSACPCLLNARISQPQGEPMITF